ncbi:Taurine catabolism dioxygenase TauD/TfdA [Cinnamomum micranthum f. kanehirae]|uniref:Taurine catabolism dioxygenase TauD/TfdA n=1 Tax=Cinnamomum micranthum f. kanehirae TaxID=337451 RepID=A0A443NW37_9MAGN|nr:Taurine catabolism dioxygenase TauD/TfdA [Cinnamomum micranthum f. kanehirae]
MSTGEEEKEKEKEKFFAELQLPQQKLDGGHLFPAVLCPNRQVDACRFIEELKHHKGWLEDVVLKRSGAILLRGFPVETASDFNAVVEAFGYEELAYVGGSASRTPVLGRVYTANDSPPDQKIPFHHEMAHAPVFPSKLFFFCEEEPKRGGETPIVLSHVVYERIKQRFPKFVAKLEEHGAIYTLVMGAVYDPSSPVGRGWQLTFSTQDKTTAEERAAQMGMKLEWMEDGVKVVAGPVEAIRIDKARGRKVWFNNVLYRDTAREDSRNDPDKSPFFGDGTLLPTDTICDCLKILDEECVVIPWQKGDILLLDNFAVLHSRQSFEPPRRILVSLCK